MMVSNTLEITSKRNRVVAVWVRENAVLGYFSMFLTDEEDRKMNGKAENAA